MSKRHPDAAAIDRVGSKAIIAHFGITRQALSYWRKNGVPKPHRKTLAMLGAIGGHAMPEMAEMRDRIAACGLCDRRADDPAVKSCTHSDCGLSERRAA